LCQLIRPRRLLLIINLLGLRRAGRRLVEQSCRLSLLFLKWLVSGIRLS
jgi:hypothetical protein